MPDQGIQLGVTLQGVDPPAAFVEHVREIEDLGYDYFWLTDSSLHARYVYSYLAIAAANSESMWLGTNCTHPHTRHPALNVNAMVTINELSGGRGILGIGAGDSPVTELGAPIAKLREVADMVELARRLHTGERFDYESSYFELAGGSIHYGLEDVAPPKVYLTVSGPKMLELAGEHADGVIVHCGAFKEGLEFALDHLRRGAERAGRTLDDIDVAWHLFGTMDTDRDRARDAARPIAAWFPLRSPLYCRIAGVPDELASQIREIYAGGEFHEAKEAHRLTTDEMVDKFCVAGTPEDWQERIAMGKSLGISHVEIFPMGERFDLVRSVANALLGA